MTYILHTSKVHKTASQADEGNSAYFQSSSAHNIKYNLWKLALMLFFVLGFYDPATRVNLD